MYCSNDALGQLEVIEGGWIHTVDTQGEGEVYVEWEDISSGTRMKLECLLQELNDKASELQRLVLQAK